MADTPEQRMAHICLLCLVVFSERENRLELGSPVFQSITVIVMGANP